MLGTTNIAGHHYGSNRRASDTAAFGIGAHHVSPTSVLATDGLELEAKKAGDGSQTSVRNGRKTRSAGNLDHSEIDGSLLLVDDSSHHVKRSVEPIKSRQTKIPFRWKPQHSDFVDGEVIPSDQAYTDMILDQGSSLPEGTTWASFVTVDSFCDRFEDRGIRRFVNTNSIKYQQETIWTVKTEHYCSKEGTWGHSSSCIFMKGLGILRVKIVHKGRKCTGEGWNSIEYLEFKVEDFIKASGEARSHDFFSQ